MRIARLSDRRAPHEREGPGKLVHVDKRKHAGGRCTGEVGSVVFLTGAAGDPLDLGGLVAGVGGAARKTNRDWISRIGHDYTQFLVYGYTWLAYSEVLTDEKGSLREACAALGARQKFIRLHCP